MYHAALVWTLPLVSGDFTDIASPSPAGCHGFLEESLEKQMPYTVVMGSDVDGEVLKRFTSVMVDPHNIEGGHTVLSSAEVRAFMSFQVYICSWH